MSEDRTPSKQRVVQVVLGGNVVVRTVGPSSRAARWRRSTSWIEWAPARRRSADRVVAGGVAAIRRRKGYRYGDHVADLRVEVHRYAAANGYPIGVDYAPSCACLSKTGYHLTVDDAEGAAMLTCCGCAARGFVADSQRYLSPSTMHRDLFRECICRGRAFEVVIGAALYEGSRDVRWWYVGARCLRCSCVGVYGDWKDDGAPWEEALRRPG